eukprot:4141831-Pleurochrysis_carterae.AAC.1
MSTKTLVSSIGWCSTGPQKAVPENHTGTVFDKNNSLWKRFGIGITDSGFSVYEDVNRTDPYHTFASLISPSSSAVRLDDPGVSDSAGIDALHDIYKPMITPITILMDKARSVFVDMQSFLGSNDAPNGVSGSESRTIEIKPVRDTATGLYRITIGRSYTDEPNGTQTEVDPFSLLLLNRRVYSLTFTNDVVSDNILHVTQTRVVEARVLRQSVDSGGNRIPNQLDVQYLFGTNSEIYARENNVILSPLERSEATITNLVRSVTDAVDDTLTLNTIEGIIDPNQDEEVRVPLLFLKTGAQDEDEAVNIAQ